MRSVTGNNAGTDKPLNERLKGELESGAVSVCSTDLTPKSDDAAKSGPVQGDVEVKAPSLAKRDPMVEAAGIAQEGPAQLATEGAAGTQSQDALNNMITEGLPKYGKVILTQSEREGFVETLISGDRFELPFELYGGRVTGTIRSRSQAETTAVIRYLNQKRRSGDIPDMLEYGTALRNILLATQVKLLNDDEYAELKAPFNRVIEGKNEDGTDKIVEPGWLSQVALWEAKQEGLCQAVYTEIRNFERKYWAMVDGADDQNFLNPEGSI